MPYTHLGMADDLIAVADDMGAARIHLVGASAGGFLVRWAAIRHPQRVETVVVMSGSGALPGDDGSQLDPDVLAVLVGLGDHRTQQDYVPYTVELCNQHDSVTAAGELTGELALVRCRSCAPCRPGSAG